MRPFSKAAILAFLLLASGCPQQPPSGVVDELIEPVAVPEAQTESAPDTEQNSSNESLTTDSETAPAIAADVANPALALGILTEEQIAEGWISLFDGESLFGWASNVPEINWRVDNGAIVADEGEPGLLLTSVPYADFELICEYRVSEEGNSGVFLRTGSVAVDSAVDFYEVNIADTHPDGYMTGSIVNRAHASSDIKGSGGWHMMKMTADGDHFIVEHEGDVTVDYHDDTAGFRASGQIGLQKNVGKIEFRKVILRPLNLIAMTNGTDLSGWRDVPGSLSEFTVEDGSIHAVNGAGFLETEQTYQDFVFQGDFKTNAENLNSGIFFRAMEGTEAVPSNGYEFQIHNGVTDGDRTLPVDSGTGAIFRRVAARRVAADDLTWATVTLIAHGPRITTWVNGYHVVDWEDDRDPNENPRQGQRLDAGHLSLQGHDPTTDVMFRNLKIAEYPKITTPLLSP